MYDLKDYITTCEVSDINCAQFCTKINDTTYQYWQLQNNYSDFVFDKELINYINSLVDSESQTIDTNKLVSDFSHNVPMAIKLVNNYNLWYEDTIDINDYTEAERMDNLLAYYTLDEIKRMKEKNYPLYIQMICEAIFELNYYGTEKLISINYNNLYISKP